MAGSLKWYVYTDDDGEKWAVLRDESNMEAVHSTPTAWGGSNKPAYTLPGNLRPRQASFKGSTGGKTTLIILDETTYDGLDGSKTITVNGETRTYSGRKGESFRREPFAGDSGEDDGDP